MATGFGTGVGKSFLTALLCKLFTENGYQVAPFKAINITSVTYTDNGREFGYSQALQAKCCRKEPDYRMNPYTIKPLGNLKFDIILEGRCLKKNYCPQFDFMKDVIKTLIGLKAEFKEVKEAIKVCFDSLSKENEIVCIEGSGPVRLFGLGSFSSLLEIANMETARITDAPVILVTENIESVKGTLSYLKEEEKKRIEGAIINRCPTGEFEKMGIGKFYLNLGLKRIKDEYQKRLGIKIFGVLPHFDELSKLPPLDPIVGSSKVPFEDWKKVMKTVSKRAKKYIELDKIYKIMV